jgi:hypothetical protein
LEGIGGAIVAEVRYEDSEPWPVEADGEGLSLELIALGSGQDYGNPGVWRLSTAVNGSPGVSSGGDPERGYDVWIGQYYGPGVEFARPDSDPDGDGFVNLLEYLFGGNPSVSDPLQPGNPKLEGGGMVFRAAAGADVAVEPIAICFGWLAPPTQFTGLYQDFRKCGLPCGLRRSLCTLQ